MIEQLILGELAENCWIYTGADSSVFLIDPGDEPETIRARLSVLQARPAYIVITHGHFDHIGALAPLLKGKYALEPVPKVAIHSLDASMLDPVKPDITLDEGATLGPFTILHTPGHTRGGICLYDKAAKVLFAGDTLFAGAYGRTDFPEGNIRDMWNSLQRLMTLPPETRVFPGHGPTTTIGDERGMYRR
jgi:glyoxylase-like metal-dependent hydrolase (beta-lactamase superfamily II)